MFDISEVEIRKLTRDEGGGYLASSKTHAGFLGDGETEEAAIADLQIALQEIIDLLDTMLSEQMKHSLLPELTSIVTLRDLRQGNKFAPQGTFGTIVHVWDDGKGYEIEFFDPINDVITADVTDVRPSDQ